jgi:hypothetical protein
MQGIGFGMALIGYCAWYTLYQKTWGDGTGFLYNLTGSARFKGTATPSSTATSGASGSSTGGAPTASDNQYNQGGTTAAPR